jgi:PAS domain-containing protein
LSGAPSDQPLTLDAGVIAAYLERMNQPDMASFVRHLSDGVAAANRRAQGHFEHCNVLAARLEKYEPKERLHDPHPPAESSD